MDNFSRTSAFKICLLSKKWPFVYDPTTSPKVATLEASDESKEHNEIEQTDGPSKFNNIKSKHKNKKLNDNLKLKIISSHHTHLQVYKFHLRRVKYYLESQ